MTQAEAQVFITSLNSILMFLPPIHTRELTEGPVARAIVGVANGILTAEIKPKEAHPA